MDEPSPARRRLGSRTAALAGVGDAGLARLAGLRVLVVGAGGLGSPVVSLLAGSGLGRLTIVDPDTVDVSNTARQTLFTAADVGAPKAQRAVDRARAVDPELDAVAIVDVFRPEQVTGHDVVVEAADSVVVTRQVSDACAEAGVPFVWGTVLGWDGQVSVFDDRVVDFHDLHPEVLPDEGSCALDGVLPALCTAVGAVMAAQVLAVGAGIGEPITGRVLTVDARSWRWAESPLRRGPASRRPTPASRRPTPAPGFDAAPRVSVHDLAADLGAAVVVDVRTPAEQADGMVPGALTAAEFAVRTPGDDRPVVVHCARGPRAEAWAREQSFPVAVLDGGFDAWRAAGLPVRFPDPLPDTGTDTGTGTGTGTSTLGRLAP